MMEYCTKERFFPFVFGVVMSLNFIAFWAVPIFAMGNIYKFGLKPILQPIYLAIEQNSSLRQFAADYVYSNRRYVDYFALSFLLLINCSISIPTMFYTQITTGTLPAWMIFSYYCSWVGIGGSMMGAAYALAHKEGHSLRMYKKAIYPYVGNFFENKLGVFFGNVPWNFTTSHIKIHHAVNGGVGDTFYLWDFPRNSVGGFMLYVHRIFLHMIGYSSIKYFEANGLEDRAVLLQSGRRTYFGVAFGILALTRSFSFLFWFYLQPLFCMTYFLALINIGFHGFLAFDNEGKRIPYVDSSCIVEGSDDLWGEDDHMSHHYNTAVYYRDLPAHQKTKEDKFKQFHASVFKKISIVELSIFILFGLWDELAKYYVDYTGELSKEEMIQMFKERVALTETTYENYSQYLHNPSPEARTKLGLHVEGLYNKDTINNVIPKEKVFSPSDNAAKSEEKARADSPSVESKKSS